MLLLRLWLSPLLVRSYIYFELLTNLMTGVRAFVLIGPYIPLICRVRSTFKSLSSNINASRIETLTSSSYDRIISRLSASFVWAVRMTFLLGYLRHSLTLSSSNVFLRPRWTSGEPYNMAPLKSFCGFGFWLRLRAVLVDLSCSLKFLEFCRKNY